ncbi:MAG: HEAT repeat domain-containing protein [Elusimicrobiota bacterium]
MACPRVLLLSVLLLPALAGVSGAKSPEGVLQALDEMLETGDWTARIYAVNQLSAVGPSALPSLSKALDDPDWQVRLTAVHRLGTYGEPAAPALRRVAREEECPWVRMSAVHWLGSLGWMTRPSEMPEDEEAPEGCQSWFWPVDRFGSASKDLARTISSTEIDHVGCQYIRYKRAGKMVCPAGTVVTGIGADPGEIGLQPGKLPEGGVALCCPAGSAAAVASKVPAPREVECRRLPFECRLPWREMQPTEGPKYGEYRDLKAHDIPWLQCCRLLDVPAAAGVPAEVLARLTSAAKPEPYRFEESRIERTRRPRPERGHEPEIYEDPIPDEELDGFPEREAARAALAKRKAANKARVAELDSLLSGSGQKLPPPEGVARRREEDHAPAASHDPPGRKIPEALPARRERLTAPEEPLRRPEAPPMRPEDEAPAVSHDPPDRKTPKPLLERRLRLSDFEEPLRRPQAPPQKAEEETTAAARLHPTEREGAESRLDRGRKGLGASESLLDRPAGLLQRRPEKVRAPLEVVEDHGTVVPHDALPSLLIALKDRSARVRSRAADEIGTLGEEAAEAVPALRKALKDESPRVRASAALALGNVTRGSDNAVRDLRRALKDRHADVRYCAAEALGRIGTSAASKAFKRHLRRELRTFLDKPSKTE